MSIGGEMKEETPKQNKKKKIYYKGVLIDE